MLPSDSTTNRPGPTCVQPFKVRPSNSDSPFDAAALAVPWALADAATTSTAHEVRPMVRRRCIVVDDRCVAVRMSESVLARRAQRGVQAAFHHLRLDGAVLIGVDAVEHLFEQLAHTRRVLARFGHIGAVV